MAARERREHKRKKFPLCDLCDLLWQFSGVKKTESDMNRMNCGKQNPHPIAGKYPGKIRISILEIGSSWLNQKLQPNCSGRRRSAVFIILPETKRKQLVDFMTRIKRA